MSDATELAAFAVGVALERFRGDAERANAFRALQLLQPSMHETAQHAAAIADAALQNVLEKLEIARIAGCGEALGDSVRMAINEVVQGGIVPGGSA